MNTWHQLPRVLRWEITRRNSPLETLATLAATCASPANLCLHSVKYPQPCPQRVARHPRPTAAQCVLPSAWYATRSPCLQRVRHPRLGLHSVQHPQQLLALRHLQAATAPCVIPAASACNLYATRSQCLHSVTCLQLLPATCAKHPQPLVCNAWHPRLVCNLSPAPTLVRLYCFWTFRRGLQCTCMQKCQTQWVAWPSSASICLWHQPWWGCIASGLFGEACSALACKSAKLNGLRDHRRPPYVDLRHDCSWSGPAPYHLNLPSVWHLRTPPACSSGSNFQFLCQILSKYRHGGGARAKP